MGAKGGKEEVRGIQGPTAARAVAEPPTDSIVRAPREM